MINFTATFEEDVLTLIPFHEIQYWWFLTYHNYTWRLYEIPNYGKTPKLIDEYETLTDAYSQAKLITGEVRNE